MAKKPTATRKPDAPPRSRRKFVHGWDEIRYVYMKAGYWCYERHELSRARPFIDRLRKLIARHDRKQEAILGAESRALIADFDGDLAREIHYQRRVCDKYNRFMEISSDNEIHDWTDVRRELEILALLYAEDEQFSRAFAVVDEIMKLCTEHRLDFDEASLRAKIVE